MHYVTINTEMKFHNKLNELKETKTPCDILIAADTIVALNEKEIIEKPRDKEHAREMLLKYNDFEFHEAQTGVFIGVLDPLTHEIIATRSILERTRVFFNKLSEEVVAAYVNSEEPFGKAGGYGI